LRRDLFKSAIVATAPINPAVPICDKVKGSVDPKARVPIAVNVVGRPIDSPADTIFRPSSVIALERDSLVTVNPFTNLSIHEFYKEVQRSKRISKIRVWHNQAVTTR
jgi:hypothetical protein